MCINRPRPTSTRGGDNYVNDVQHEPMLKRTQHVRARKDDARHHGDADDRRSGILVSRMMTVTDRLRWSEHSEQGDVFRS